MAPSERNSNPGIPGSSTRQTQIRKWNEQLLDPGDFGGSDVVTVTRLALNLARATPDPHTKSMRGKLKRASWDDRCILKLLGSAGKVKDSTEKNKIQKR